jgi:hypothetical protein
MGIEINPVVDLAAAFADEGQSHAIEEAQAAADVGGGFAAGEVANRHGGQWKFSDGIGRSWHRPRWFREVERQLSQEQRRLRLRMQSVCWHGIYVLQSRSSCVVPSDFIDAFPASTMAQEEDFVRVSFAEFSAELLPRRYLVIGALSHRCARLNVWLGLSYAEISANAG